MIFIPNESLSEHFDLYDLTHTNHEVDNTPSLAAYNNLKYRLAPVLEKIYNEIHPFSIESGYRSSVLNQKVGGAEGSYHMDGIAADLTPRFPMTPEEFWVRLYDHPEIRNQLGEIALKKSNVHVSLAQPPIKVGLPLDGRSGSYIVMNEQAINQVREQARGDQAIVQAGMGAGILLLAGSIAFMVYRLRKARLS